MQNFFVYILKFNDGTYYIGVTNDVHKRFEEHRKGLDPKSYTYKRQPVELIYFSSFNSIGQAIEKESIDRRKI